MSHKIENKRVRVEVGEDDFTTVQVNDNNVAIIVNPNDKDWIYGEYMRIRRKRVRAVTNVSQQGGSGGGGSEPAPEPIPFKSVDLERTSSQYLTIADASQTGLDLGDESTLEIWVKLEQLPSTPNLSMVLMAKHPTGWLFSLNNTNTITFFYSDGTNTTQRTTTTAAVVAGDVGKWVYFAVTVKTSTKDIHIYKGYDTLVPYELTLTSNSNNAISIIDNAIAFRIGSNNNNAAYLDGKVSSARVWSTVKTKQQLIDSYKKVLEGTETNLVSSWNFNDSLNDNGPSGNNLSFAGSGLLVYDTDVPFSNELLVTGNVDNYQVYQRSSNQYVLTISGNYYGTAEGIEARILEDGTSTEVVTWTTIDSSLNAGLFSGQITIPEGGWYNVELRKSDQTSVTSKDRTIGVGIVIPFLGQSHARAMFTFTSSPDSPNTLLRQKNENGIAVPTGNGVIKFGNALISALGLPICCANYAVGGSALFYDNRAAAPNDNWWLDEGVNTSDIWDAWITGYGELGSNFEYFVWMQGDQDAEEFLKSKSEYKAGLASFRTTQVNGETKTTKWIMSQLARTTDAGIGDTGWQAIKDAQLEYSDENIANTLLFVTIDGTLQDTIHMVPASYGVFGLRAAQCILYDKGEVTYYLAPRISSFTVTGADTVDVNITHVGGTDFTPTSGITGFSATDNTGALTITSAVRTNATTITLTFNRSIDGPVTLRYMYGRNPTVTGAVYDNSSLTLPLLPNSNITEV